MKKLTEDYADSIAEGFYDDSVSDRHESEREFDNYPCIDEFHFDVIYETYIQGVRDGESVSSASTPNVVIGVQYQDADTSVPLDRRFLLTIQEASEYYGLGVKTLYRIIHNNREAEFILEIGSHYKIKRELFEEFLKYSTNLD